MGVVYLNQGLGTTVLNKAPLPHSKQLNPFVFGLNTCRTRLVFRFRRKCEILSLGQLYTNILVGLGGHAKFLSKSDV